MEKKSAKKSVAKKKTVEPKAAAVSPWAEIAAPVPEPPAQTDKAPKAAKRSRKVPSTAKAKKASTPRVAASAPVKAKKTSKNVTAAPIAAAADAPPKKAARSKKKIVEQTAEIAAIEPTVEMTPVFKTLSEPKLPDLVRENRARLMMQTPAKLYFYWSVRENPYQLLRKAFGDDLGSYTLVLKLTEMNRGVEEFHRADPEGNWWFNVEPDGKYEAEIGFYAPNRPYFRVLYSNTVETPRRSPSRRVAGDMDWRVSASKFAEVLDVAGFSQDAVDVAMAGDDHDAAEYVTHAAFTRFIGGETSDLSGIAAEDIRYSLMALAAGTAINELRSRISPSLFAILQANAERIAAKNAASILSEYFDIGESEFTEHQYGSAVHGASVVNFPRTIRTRLRYKPVSSHSFR